jgi:hypothetical protein
MLDVVVSPSTQQDVENLIFIGFGHYNLRFVRFDNLINGLRNEEIMGNLHHNYSLSKLYFESC